MSFQVKITYWSGVIWSRNISVSLPSSVLKKMVGSLSGVRELSGSDTDGQLICAEQRIVSVYNTKMNTKQTVQNVWPVKVQVQLFDQFPCSTWILHREISDCRGQPHPVIAEHEEKQNHWWWNNLALWEQSQKNPTKKSLTHSEMACIAIFSFPQPPLRNSSINGSNLFPLRCSSRDMMLDMMQCLPVSTFTCQWTISHAPAIKHLSRWRLTTKAGSNPADDIPNSQTDFFQKNFIFTTVSQSCRNYKKW